MFLIGAAAERRGWRVRLWPTARAVLDELVSADLLFNVGGGNLNSIMPRELYKKCTTHLAARIMRKPVILSGQTIGPLTKRIGDVAVIRIGFPLSALGLVAIMLASQYWTLITALGFFSLANALLIPAITSQTSKRANMPQGIAMGLSNSFISLGRIFGPILGGWVFDLDWRLPFLIGAIFMLAGFAASIQGVKGKE